MAVVVMVVSMASTVGVVAMRWSYKVVEVIVIIMISWL